MDLQHEWRGNQRYRAGTTGRKGAGDLVNIPAYDDSLVQHELGDE